MTQSVKSPNGVAWFFVQAASEKLGAWKPAIPPGVVGTMLQPDDEYGTR